MTLSELKELALKATPGPWAFDLAGTTVTNLSILFPEDEYPCFNRYGDVQYIAAADPQTVLQLIERIEALSIALLKINNWIHYDCDIPKSDKEYISKIATDAVYKYGADVPLEEK